jgi:hypothetical protein
MADGDGDDNGGDGDEGHGDEGDDDDCDGCDGGDDGASVGRLVIAVASAHTSTNTHAAQKHQRVVQFGELQRERK